MMTLKGEWQITDGLRGHSRFEKLGKNTAE